MKLLNATALTLCPLAWTSAQTNQVGSSMDQQTIKITRNGTLISQQGPAENFTGSVSVQYLVQPKSIAGVVGGGMDSFFIERLLRGFSPKFFIEHLRQIKVGRDHD
jgi:hypothetical protein